tara:strand:+ start:116 stop:847 length:732 start_codon:yes stop_codon:yes gene_type:complete
MKVLELFSGTGSIGTMCKKRNWEIISLDKDMPSDINEDIMTWNYKVYPTGYFDLITASPVCLWWSKIRKSWIGRKIKAHGDNIITLDILNEDINIYGKPMVDKVREIIKYFNPRYYWIENPQTGSMKDYITDLQFYDVDYCKYASWGYQKRTRFWTNIPNFTPKLCNKDCDSMDTKTRHKTGLNGCGKVVIDGKTIYLDNKVTRDKYRNDIRRKSIKSTTKLERYRIPYKLINDLLDCCILLP